ncbi:Uncharacterized protein PCOAH_00011510 [Plasmodium coatneyi]|uniref:VPS9 domain-containing protein n=1 Tax=Plasmodium coatneyi TaxID=208452 RepID=A0A1B1DVP2_9APIC|nr:Uncharacterized protein PCOAH_00011510 [Plasmodium coatneyi]ANQ06853.1 Uncharacterized protein PCOAH_00011510 [Plasmodium coatneyi]
MYSRNYLCEDDEWGVEEGQGLPSHITEGERKGSKVTREKAEKAELVADEVNGGDFFCDHLEGTHGKAPQLGSIEYVSSGSEAKLVRGSSKQSLPRGENHSSRRHVSVRHASMQSGTSMRCATERNSSGSILWFDSNDSVRSQGGRKIKEKQKGERINQAVDHATDVLTKDHGRLHQVKEKMNSSFDLWESSNSVGHPEGEVQQLEEDLLLKGKTNLYNYKFSTEGEASSEGDQRENWGELNQCSELNSGGSHHQGGKHTNVRMRSQDVCHADYVNGKRRESCEENSSNWSEPPTGAVRTKKENSHVFIKQKQMNEVDPSGRRGLSSTHRNQAKKTPSSGSLHNSNMSSHQTDHPKEGEKKITQSKKEGVSVKGGNRLMRSISTTLSERSGRQNRQSSVIMSSSSSRGDDLGGSQRPFPGADSKGATAKVNTKMKKKKNNNSNSSNRSNNNLVFLSDDEGSVLDTTAVSEESKFFHEIKAYLNYKSRVGTLDEEDATHEDDALHLDDASSEVPTQRGNNNPLEWDIQVKRSENAAKRRSASRKKQPARQSLPAEGETVSKMGSCSSSGDIVPKLNAGERHTNPTSHQRSDGGKRISQNVGEEEEGGHVAKHYSEVNAGGVNPPKEHTKLTPRREKVERIDGMIDLSEETKKTLHSVEYLEHIGRERTGSHLPHGRIESPPLIDLTLAEETNRGECRGVAPSAHVRDGDKLSSEELGKKSNGSRYSPERNVIGRKDDNTPDSFDTEQVEQHPPPTDGSANSVGNNAGEVSSLPGGENGPRIRFPFPQRGKKFKDIFISFIRRGDAGRSNEVGTNHQEGRSPDDGSNGQVPLEREMTKEATQTGEADEAEEGEEKNTKMVKEAGDISFEANSPGRKKPNTLYNNFLESLKHPSCRNVIDKVRIFIQRFPKNVSREVAANKIHEFINETQPILLNCHIYKSVNKYQANVIIEGYEKFLLQKLHPYVYRMDPKDKDEDEKIYTKINCLQWVELKHLEIAEDIQLDRLKQAQAELLRIQKMRAPNDKLIMVLNCCRVVTSAVYAAKKNSKRRMQGGKQHGLDKQNDPVVTQENAETTVESDAQDMQCDGAELGISKAESDVVKAELDDDELLPCADEVLPVLIYVIIKTNPPELISNIAYIQSFRHPNHFVSEEAYSFTQFCSGVEFIKELGKSTFLNIPEEEYKKKVSQAEQFYLDEVKESNKKLQEAAGKLTSFIKLSNEKKLCVNVINKIEDLQLRFEGEDNFNALTVSKLADMFEEYKMLVRLKNEILRDMQEHEQAVSAGDA